MTVQPPRDNNSIEGLAVSVSNSKSRLQQFSNEELQNAAISIFVDSMHGSYLLGANPTVSRNYIYSNAEHANQVATEVASAMIQAGYTDKDPEFSMGVLRGLLHDGGELIREEASFGGESGFVDETGKFVYEQHVMQYWLTASAKAYVTGDLKGLKTNLQNFRNFAFGIKNPIEGPKILSDAMNGQKLTNNYAEYQKHPARRPLKFSELPETPVDTQINAIVAGLIKDVYTPLEDKTVQTSDFYTSLVKQCDKVSGSHYALFGQLKKKSEKEELVNKSTYHLLQHQHCSRIYDLQARNEKYLPYVKKLAATTKEKRLFEIVRQRCYALAKKFMAEGPAFIAIAPDTSTHHFYDNKKDWAEHQELLELYADIPFDPAEPSASTVIRREEAIDLYAAYAQVPGAIAEGNACVLSATDHPEEVVRVYNFLSAQRRAKEADLAPYKQKIAAKLAAIKDSGDMTQKEEAPAQQGTLDFTVEKAAKPSAPFVA